MKPGIWRRVQAVVVAALVTLFFAVPLYVAVFHPEARWGKYGRKAPLSGFGRVVVISVTGVGTLGMGFITISAILRSMERDPFGRGGFRRRGRGPGG
jgi:NADH:ubiquinone oxidoreductase subunit 5 (subunit L)/multisubunit Na+/H+ antiporter MnhA subunit